MIRSIRRQMFPFFALQNMATLVVNICGSLLTSQVHPRPALKDICPYVPLTIHVFSSPPLWVRRLTPVTQRTRVRSPVGTSFLGKVYWGFFLICKTNVRKLYAPTVREYHLNIIIVHNHSLRAPMT